MRTNQPNPNNTTTGTRALARKGPGLLTEFSVYDYGPGQALCRRIYTKDPGACVFVRAGVICVCAILRACVRACVRAFFRASVRFLRAGLLYVCRGSVGSWIGARACLRWWGG